MSPEKNNTPLPKDILKSSKGDLRSPINRVLVVLLMLLTAVLGVVIFVLVNGYLNNSQPTQTNTQVVPTKIASPSATITPTPKDEKEEAEQIDVGSDSASFEDVQKDIQGL